jgi:hypothetical protein
VDVQEWYLAQSEHPSYFMFGPVAQSVLGLDWIELVLRGGILALIFAKVHRWYAGRERSYWTTLFYLFLTVWSFYTIRSYTFGFVYSVVYRFLPAFLLACAARRLLTGFRGTSASVAR